MRYVFLCVLLSIGVSVFGQNPTNYIPYKQRTRQYSLMLDSMLYIPRYNGAPSGVRTNETSSIDGAIAMDTVNNRVYIYSGGGWVRVGNYSDITGYAVDSIWRVAGTDSIFWSKNGTTYKIKDSTGGGGSGGIGSYQDSVANVRDFGAVGDGVTEDSVAFKNAVATGRPVFIPKGIYKMTATLHPSSRQMIFGTGNTSIIYTNANRSVIRTSDSCTIKDISFRGSGLSTLPGNTDTVTQNGVWVNGYNNRVTGCTFIKFAGRGVWIYSPTIANMEGNLITDNVADSNTVAFASSFGSNYGLFANNTARYNVYGYYEFSAANMTNNSNIYQGNTNAMYFASGDLRGSIVNCQLNHSSVTFTQGSIYGMIISDCSFFNTNLNIGTVDTVKFLNISNSRFVGCTITATRADSCQVLGGRFMQTVTVTGSGIKFHDVIGTANAVNEFWGGIGVSDSSFHTRQGISIGRGIYAPNLTSFSDTTNWKPVVINTTGTGATAGTFRKATYWPGGGGTYTASNGLTLSGSNFKLGGALGENTQIALDGFDLIIPDFSNFADTTNWKPVVINTTGSGATAGVLRKATYWPGGGSSGWGLTGNTLGAYGSYLGTNDNYDLRFFTNGTERMRVDSALGSVGIGVAPQTDYLLTVKSNASATGGLKITSDQTYPILLRFHNDAFGNLAYFNTAFGRVQFIIDNSGYDYQITQGANVIQTYDVNNGTYFGRRMQTKQGADVASANNLTLGGDGNVFEITGTTQINLINNTNWQNGAEITLTFSSSVTVKNNQGTSGSNVNILLAGGADFAATADDLLTLVLCEVGGTQAWREKSRSVN